MLPKTCTPRCCGATDTDQSPQCFQVVYSTHPSGTGLTAHPGIRLSQADWVPPCPCCSQGSWAPGEGSSEAQTDAQPLPVPVPILQDPSPCPAEAGGHPAVGGGLWPSGGWRGNHTHHRRLLGQRSPIFQELGESLHVSGTFVLDHLEPRDGRGTRGHPILWVLAEPGWPHECPHLPFCPAPRGSSAG